MGCRWGVRVRPVRAGRAERFGGAGRALGLTGSAVRAAPWG
ncbi:hypothetical protein ACFYN9_30280 [Streptomyces collinus]